MGLVSRARLAASTIGCGVVKSGSPISRWTTSRPCASTSRARVWISITSNGSIFAIRAAMRRRDAISFMMGILPSPLEDIMANKEAALSFLRLCASGKARDAYAKFAAPGFRHHNPYFPGTADALIAGMEDNARQFPDKTLDVKNALEDGDFVALHSH